MNEIDEDFWSLNRDVLLAEIDEDLAALALVEATNQDVRTRVEAGRQGGKQ